MDSGKRAATGTVALRGKGSVLMIRSKSGAGSLRERTQIRGDTGQQVQIEPGERMSLKTRDRRHSPAHWPWSKRAHAMTARGKRESLLVATYRTAADGLGGHDHRSTDQEH